VTLGLWGEGSGNLLVAISPRPADGFRSEEAIAAWVLVAITRVALGLGVQNTRRALGCPVFKHHYREVTPGPLSIAKGGALPGSQRKVLILWILLRVRLSTSYGEQTSVNT